VKPQPSTASGAEKPCEKPMPSGMPRDPGMAMAEGPPSGYEPCQGNERGGGSMAAVSQLFTRLAQEIEEQKPKNCIHFVVDFLCKHYPEHLHGFASIWQMDPDLERERHEVVNFFKAHKISTAVAAHFTNAGYDTLDTLTTLSPDSLVDVEAFNNVKWLPGHKVRLQQIFSEISARVRAYRQQYGEGARQPRRHQPQQGQHHHAHAERRYDSDHGFHHHAGAHHDSYQPRNHSPPRHEVHSYAHGHAALSHHAQAPQHDQRHVAFAGGFSGGYNGGFAPPQAVAPSMAPCPVTVTAAPCHGGVMAPVPMAGSGLVPCGGSVHGGESGHTSPVRRAAPAMMPAGAAVVRPMEGGMKLQPGLTPSPNIFLSNPGLLPPG